MDTRLLLEQLEELHNEPTSPDRRPVGCLLILAAVAGFLLFPTLDGALPLPALFGKTALVLFGVMAAAGVALALFGSGNRYGRVLAQVEAAVAVLVGDGSTPLDFQDPEFQKAAVRLLGLAHYSDGPTTVATFDRREMFQRLGPAIHGVVVVERALLEEGAIYEVFTGGPAEPED